MAQQEQKKPNILVIMGDDIGMWNVGVYAPPAAQSFIAAHLKSLKEYPPRQGADTLSLHKALEAAMAKMEAARTTNN